MWHTPGDNPFGSPIGHWPQTCAFDRTDRYISTRSVRCTSPSSKVPSNLPSPPVQHVSTCDENVRPCVWGARAWHDNTSPSVSGAKSFGPRPFWGPKRLPETFPNLMIPKDHWVRVAYSGENGHRKLSRLHDPPGSLGPSSFWALKQIPEADADPMIPL